MKFSSIVRTSLLQLTFMNKVLGHEGLLRRNLQDGLSDSQKEEMLDKHNDLRRAIANGDEGSHPAATNMIKMEWSDELSTVAQNWADGCVFAHNSGRNGEQDTFDYVGENLYAATGDFSAEGSVQSWYDEQEDFTYSSNSCSAVCGHYTQVVSMKYVFAWRIEIRSHMG